VKTHTMIAAVLLGLGCACDAQAEDRPYLTTQSPITLFNTSDGEHEAFPVPTGDVAGKTRIEADRWPTQRCS